MTGAGSLRGAAASAALLLLAACAGGSDAAPPRAAAPAMPAEAALTPPLQPAPGRAERVAAALLDADRAEQAGDGAALAAAALRLERLGAAPQTAADGAALTRWIASLPADRAPMRGRALGPAYRSGRLNPGAVSMLNQTFLGGRSARIVVRVARGPAPRLVVRDQADRQVCAAADDPITCRWVPLYTQRHRIEIVNPGAEMSQFYIVFD